MRRLRRLLLTALLALAAVLASTAPAVASRGISSSATTIGVSGVLTINGTTSCNVLLTLTLHDPTIEKVTSPGFGRIVQPSSITNCTGLATRGVVLAPISVFFDAFSGGLPAITNILVSAGGPGADFGVLLQTSVGSCLYGTAAVGREFGPIDIQRNAATGLLVELDFQSSSSVPKVSGPVLCPANATIRGSLATWLATAPRTTLV